jgi:hypothetical protein
MEAGRVGEIVLMIFQHGRTSLPDLVTIGARLAPGCSLWCLAAACLRYLRDESFIYRVCNVDSERFPYFRAVIVAS